MENVVNGLKELNDLLDSGQSLLKEIQKLEQDEKRKEDKTQGLIEKLKQGNITEDLIKEIEKEEKIEVKEEDKIVNLLKQVVKEDEKGINILKNVTKAIAQEEKQEDQNLQQLKQEIVNIKERGLTKENLTTVMSHAGKVGNILLDEADEELKASQLSKKLAQELEISSREIINSEKLEKEEEFEERELEQIAQRINNKQLMEFTKELEKHTKRDENLSEKERKMIIKEESEFEQVEEQLRKETVHTYEEAEELLQLLRQLKQMVQGSPLEDKNFQQNFGRLMNEVEEAEKETKKAAENEEKAEAKAEQGKQEAQAGA